MAEKKKTKSKYRSPEPTKARVPQKPPFERKLRLHLGVKLKEEILGILTMAVCVLMILAVVTHDPTENSSNIVEIWRRGELHNLLGIAGAYFAARLMRALLYQVKPVDPVTLVGVTALLLLIAFAAAWIPARRAMRVDPIDALRYE